jgi:hypothetical protein
VRCAGELLTEMPRNFSIERREERYELVAGRHRMHFAQNPAELLGRLERWCRWWFGEFVPQAEPSAGRSPAAARLWEREVVPCPECGLRLRPCVGDVAIVLASPWGTGSEVSPGIR